MFIVHIMLIGHTDTPTLDTGNMKSRVHLVDPSLISYEYRTQTKSEKFGSPITPRPDDDD